jgi:hypothetical protein
MDENARLLIERYAKEIARLETELAAEREKFSMLMVDDEKQCEEIALLNLRLYEARAELAAANERADIALQRAYTLECERDIIETELLTERHSASVSDQCCVAEMCARKNAEDERDALRAELAARDELLREARGFLLSHHGATDGLIERIDAALKGDE